MAEGYVFTSATDVNDLLNQIISQAAVHGWTQNELSTFSSAGRRGHISKDGVTLNFCSMPGPNADTGNTNTILDTIIPRDETFLEASLRGAPLLLMQRRPPPLARIFDQLANDVIDRLQPERSAEEDDGPIPLLV